MTIKVGTRIRMSHMPDDPDPIPAGTLGTVRGSSPGFLPSDGDVLWVSWDNGRSLNVLVGVDQFDIVGEEA